MDKQATTRRSTVSVYPLLLQLHFYPFHSCKNSYETIQEKRDRDASFPLHRYHKISSSERSEKFVRLYRLSINFPTLQSDNARELSRICRCVLVSATPAGRTHSVFNFSVPL